MQGNETATSLSCCLLRVHNNWSIVNAQYYRSAHHKYARMYHGYAMIIIHLHGSFEVRVDFPSIRKMALFVSGCYRLTRVCIAACFRACLTTWTMTTCLRSARAASSSSSSSSPETSSNHILRCSRSAFNHWFKAVILTWRLSLFRLAVFVSFS